MALWAKYMLVATVVSIFVGGIGVILVWKTLVSTNNAVSENRRSNDINAAAQRPWITFEAEFRGVPSFNLGAGMIFLPLNFSIRNDGVSPALETHVWLDAFQTKSFDFFVEYDRVIESYKPTTLLVDEPLFKNREKNWSSGVKLDIREADGDIVLVVTMFYRGIDSAKLHHTCIFFYANIEDEVSGSLREIIYHFKMV